MKPQASIATHRRWKSMTLSAGAFVAASAVVLAGTAMNSNGSRQDDRLQVQVVEEVRPSFLSELPERTAAALEAGAIVPTAVTEDAPLTTVVASLGLEPPSPQPEVAAAQEADDLELFRVTTNGLNVREAPSGASGKLLVLKQDEAVQVAEIDGNWARVTTASGDSGWASMRYLAPAD